MKEKDDIDNSENEKLDEAEENTELNSNPNNELFDNLILFFDNLIINNSENLTKENKEKIILKFDELKDKGIDITLLLDNFNNTLIQYYIQRDSVNIDFILLIINYYHKSFSNDNCDKFYNWLINDNNLHQNFYEILIERQFPLKKEIEYFNKTFLYINSGDNSLIYKILKDRVNNMFHIVVKQNNIPILLFLYEKLKNYFPSTNVLDIPNKEGMTSLHISCSYSLKDISDVLLLLGSNIDSKDLEGNTPLHYAVRVENYRLTKKLIIFGAKKNIGNNLNMLPGDIAFKRSNFSIRKLFKKNFCNNIDSIANKRRDNVLFILIIFCFLIKCYFFFKIYKNYNFMIYIFISSFILDIICCIYSFYPKLCPNKSNSPKKKSKIEYKFEDIFSQYNYDLDKIELLCPVCKTLRIKQSNIKHCIICNKCITNWDHHCYWLNICISKDNYNIFLFFIVFLFFDICFNIIAFIKIILDFKVLEPDFNFMNFIIYLILLFILFILFYGAYTLLKQIYMINKNKKIEKQKIVSLEDFLSNSSSSTLLSENSNKNDKDINTTPGESQSIEFQELNI